MPSKPKAKAVKPAKPAAPARLGDDLTPPGEVLNVIVARSHVVGGKVHVELPSPGTVRARRGQRLQVKHVYRAEENSPDKEEFRFLLRSSLDRQEHAPAIARIGDVYALPEDVGGYLVHEFTVGAAGTQTLTFEVGAEYVAGGWKDGLVKAHEQKQAKGTIKLVVG